MSRSRWNRPRAAALLVAAVMWLGFGAAARAEPPHLGLLWDRFPLTLGEGCRTEAAGPFFHDEQTPERSQWALSPFFAHVQRHDVDAEEMDVLYPLLTYDRYGREYRFQIMQLLSFAGGANQSEEMVRRFTLFPFYFQQRGPEPKDNYTALFPFHGTIRNKLMRDEVKFTLFPLYGQSRKRDVVTDNYLYPLFHLRHGDGLEGWQFWPLFGRERKVPTERTSDLGFPETVPGHEKSFALWPLYLRQRTGLGGTNENDFRAVLPFYAHATSPTREFTSLLYPFFSWADDRTEGEYWEWNGPFPFVTFTRGPKKTIDRVFPFYSFSRTATRTNLVLGYPLYSRRTLRVGALERDRTRLLLFSSDRLERNLDTGATERRLELWPLITQTTEPDGSVRGRSLALLDPVLAKNKSIERSFAPLYSLYRWERNAKTGAASHSLLWNLYRDESTPEKKRWSCLFGLVRREAQGGEARWRVCFIPFRTHRAPPPEPVFPSGSGEGGS